MKVWTQAQVDAAVDQRGVLELGTGDFRAADFRGRARVVIGSHSILGHGVRLGKQCDIGSHCEIGRDFKAGAYLTVGEHTRFGAGARISENSELSRGVMFGEGCVLALGTRIGDDVTLPAHCSLFGMPGASGKTLLRVSALEGRTYYSFIAFANGIYRMFVSANGGAPVDIDAFMDVAIRRATDASSADAQIKDGRQLLALAKYLQTRAGLLLM